MIHRRARSLVDVPKWARRVEGDGMPLDPKMIHSAVRVIGDVPGSPLVIGTKRGTIGTGFIVTVMSERHADVRYGYVITADHVIEGQSRVDVQIPNPFGNGELYPPIEVRDWRQPLSNVDLAAAPIPYPPAGRAYSAIPFETQIPTEPPMLAMAIYYIGMLEPLNRPMVRSGTIGALDQENVASAPYDYPAHLVDCRSYGGFSGSPCYVHVFYSGLTPSPEAAAIAKPQGIDVPLAVTYHFAVLCGMFTEHLTDVRSNVVSAYGVGVMVRAQEIREALVTDEMKDERRQWDDKRDAAQPDGPTLEPATSRNHEDEYARFEDLTRQLVNTPKAKTDGGESGGDGG